MLRAAQMETASPCWFMTCRWAAWFPSQNTQKLVTFDSMFPHLLQLVAELPLTPMPLDIDTQSV